MTEKYTCMEPCRIRVLSENEYPLLKKFLYLAVFVPKGMTPPEEEITELPEMRVYTDDFGKRKGDYCLAAECDGEVVGLVWTRIMNDYGHVDDRTPSFAISLLPEFRGRGIGTAMMKEMLQTLKRNGYEQASLSVQKENHPAVSMYRSLGFIRIEDRGEEDLMICRLA